MSRHLADLPPPDWSRRKRARLWLLEHLPAGLLWHPAEWFLVFLCVTSGVLSLAAPIESESLRALLPGPFVRMWGVLLLVGAAALGSGLASIKRIGSDRYVVTRVPAYRLGLRLLGLATGVYIVALVIVAGWDGVIAAVIPAAFVAMCGVRLLTLGGRE